MGRLTTHVLDTAQGCPGEGIKIDVYRLEQGQRIALKSVTTNDDGRCDAPILEGDDFRAGDNELVITCASKVVRPANPASLTLFLFASGWLTQRSTIMYHCCSLRMAIPPIAVASFNQKTINETL